MSSLEMVLLIITVIIVTVLLVLLGAFVYWCYVKSIAKVDISFPLSCKIVLLGFAGCAVFFIIFALLATAVGANGEPILFTLIAFILGTIGVQSFIYFFMTKSVDGVQITRLHAFILSVIFLLPGFIAMMAAMFAVGAFY